MGHSSQQYLLDLVHVHMLLLDTAVPNNSYLATRLLDLA